MASNTSTDQQAVSPVVGVILVVAITVLLSAVIGVFVFDLGSSLGSADQQSDIGVRTTYNDNGTATIQVITGDADEIRVLVNGTESPTTLLNPSPGESLTVNATQDSGLTILSVNEGKSSIVSSTPVSSSNPTAPTEALVAYWTMDDAHLSGGTLTDATGNGHDATIQNSPTTGQVGVKHESFNFSTDYLTVSNNASFFAENLTVSAWVHPDTFNTTNRDNIVSTDEYNKKGWVLRVGSGRAQLTMGDGNGWTGAAAPDGSVETGKWQHIVGVYNGTHIKIYVNGTLLDTSAGPDNLPNSGLNLTIGQQSSPYDRYFDGRIDEVRVYTQSLTDQEVKDLYEATK